MFWLSGWNRGDDNKTVHDAPQLFAALVAGERPGDAAITTLDRLSSQAPAALRLNRPVCGQPSVTVQPASSDPVSVRWPPTAHGGICLLGRPDRPAPDLPYPGWC